MTSFWSIGQFCVQEKYRALKYGGLMFGIVALGAAIPFSAVWFQLEKAKT
jgi:hypothetical protein